MMTHLQRVYYIFIIDKKQTKTKPDCTADNYVHIITIYSSIGILKLSIE